MQDKLDSTVHSGKCRDFDRAKGYGWITPDDPNVNEIFVHWKDIITDQSFKALITGQCVQYQIMWTKEGKKKAVNVTDTNYVRRNHVHSNKSETNGNTANTATNTEEFKLETRFRWQWQDDCGKWQNFDSETNKTMLSALCGDTRKYTIGQFDYAFAINRYDDKKATQRNLRTGTIRQCRKISSTFSIHENLTLAKMLNVSENDPYPRWWFDVDAEIHDSHLVDWPLDNQICVEIIEMFTKSQQASIAAYDINAIYSVQNKYLWKHYQFQRTLHSEAIGNNKLNEKYLFHGTEYDATQHIIVQGFLRDHGKIMAYGRGTYFAKDASMSVDYSPQDANGNQWMFLCAVILGESCVGQRSYTVPPSKPNSSVHYESMVDDLLNPKIFVISKDYQAYPLFLIRFTETTGHSLFGFSLASFPKPVQSKKNKNKRKQQNKATSQKSLIPVKTKTNFAAGSSFSSSSVLLPSTKAKQSTANNTAKTSVSSTNTVFPIITSLPQIPPKFISSLRMPTTPLPPQQNQINNNILNSIKSQWQPSKMVITHNSNGNNIGNNNNNNNNRNNPTLPAFFNLPPLKLPSIPPPLPTTANPAFPAPASGPPTLYPFSMALPSHNNNSNNAIPPAIYSKRFNYSPPTMTASTNASAVAPDSDSNSDFESQHPLWQSMNASQPPKRRTASMVTAPYAGITNANGNNNYLKVPNLNSALRLPATNSNNNNNNNNVNLFYNNLTNTHTPPTPILSATNHNPFHQVIANGNLSNRSSKKTPLKPKYPLSPPDPFMQQSPLFGFAASRSTVASAGSFVVSSPIRASLSPTPPPPYLLDLDTQTNLAS